MKYSQVKEDQVILNPQIKIGQFFNTFNSKLRHI